MLITRIEVGTLGVFCCSKDVSDVETFRTLPLLTPVGFECWQ